VGNNVTKNSMKKQMFFFSLRLTWERPVEMHGTKVALRRANQLITFRFGRLNAVNSGTSLRASCSNQSPCEFNLVGIGALRLVGATSLFLYCGDPHPRNPKMRLVEPNLYIKAWGRERERERDRERQRQTGASERETEREGRKKQKSECKSDSLADRNEYKHNERERAGRREG